MNSKSHEASDQGDGDQRRDDPHPGDDVPGTAQALAKGTGDAAASLGAEMKQAAQATSKAIGKQVETFAREVGHELGATVEKQRARGADAMNAFSRAMTAAAAELKEQSPAAAGYARDAAQSIKGFSHSIRDRSATELMHSATDAARTRPMLFFAGAIAAGFTFSRFLKSSATHEHSDRKEHADD